MWNIGQADCEMWYIPKVGDFALAKNVSCETWEGIVVYDTTIHPVPVEDDKPTHAYVQNIGVISWTDYSIAYGVGYCYNQFMFILYDQFGW